MKKPLKIIIVMSLILVSAFTFLRFRYSSSKLFPDRTGSPVFKSTNLEIVAETDSPPGNIAVSPSGRVFFTFHPEAKPSMNVIEWREGKAVPYPNIDYQPGGKEPLAFQEILSIRIDLQGRLWVLDNARHGTGQPRILAFNLADGGLVHHYDFTSDIFGIGSHANDFQVDPKGETVYISDASIIAKTPAIIVYNIKNGRCRRVLEGHYSVKAEDYQPVVQGVPMTVFGFFTIKPGVDGIALDKEGKWLYFASITSNYLYRINTALLKDENIRPGELGNKVEKYSQKTMTDGMTVDVKGNVYLSDAEHSAILRITPDRRLETLLKDQVLRWPDGFSFGPQGWLYIACSSLHHVIGRSREHIKKNSPYQVFRFKPGVAGVPGH